MAIDFFWCWKLLHVSVCWLSVRLALGHAGRLADSGCCTSLAAWTEKVDLNETVSLAGSCHEGETNTMNSASTFGLTNTIGSLSVLAANLHFQLMRTSNSKMHYWDLSSMQRCLFQNWCASTRGLRLVFFSARQTRPADQCFVSMLRWEVLSEW